MRTEHILFILFFLVLPLLQRIAEERRKKRLADLERSSEQDLDEEPEPEPQLFLPPPEPWAPPPAPVVHAPPVERVATPRPKPSAERPRAERPRAEQPPAPRAHKRHPAHAELRAVLPRDAKGLRRAMLLLEILGPPRSLEPPSRRNLSASG